MGKLLFALLVLVVGLALYGAIRRRANLLRDAALAEARGVADALRIKGEAEAAYNARVAASLTPVLIQQQYLARWDGKLPQYALGGNAVPFVQIPGPSR